MKILSPLSPVFLGAALAVAPSVGMAQKAPTPETTIPRHTDKGGHGNFAPPADRKLPPDAHHDIPAHPNHGKHARNTKKPKNDSSGSKSNGSASGSSGVRDSQVILLQLNFVITARFGSLTKLGISGGQLRPVHRNLPSV